MRQSTAEKILNNVKQSYSAIADDFNATRNYLWPGLEKFLEYVKPNDKILDLGCGNGRLVKLFADIKANYTGIDNNPTLIELAKKNYPNHKFLTGDVLMLPFSDNEFDVIFCIALLHHIPSNQLRQKALSEMHRVLKPKGILIMTNWNLFNIKLNQKYKNKFISHFFKFTLLKLFGKSNLDFKDAFIPFGQDKIPRYYHYFTMSELKNLVKKTGFKIIKTEKNRNLEIIAGNW